MTKFDRAALAALACLAWTMPAAAKSPTFYADCDGYGSPTENGDGMTKEARGLFGLFAPLGSAGNTRRSTPNLGAHGVQACDQALADSRLLAKHWRRKVSLLRARAVHDLAAGNDAQALADLARAEAAAEDPADPFYRRSLGLGNRIVRAYALRRSGRQEEALKLAAEILAERPYNRQIAVAVIAIIGDPMTEIGGETAGRLAARLEPRLIDILFRSAFDRRDFDQAIALHPQLTLPVVAGDIGVGRNVERLQAARNEAFDLLYKGERQGRLAYALAATGRTDEARRQIEDARKYLAANTPAVPPATAEESGKQKQARLRIGFVALGATQGGKMVDEWSRLVEWRIAVDRGEARRVLAEANPASLPVNGAHLDLLLALKRALPGEAGLDPAIAAIEGKLRPQDSGRGEEVKLLFGSLPHAEIEQRVAAFKRANSDFVGYLWGGVSGFKTEGDPRTGNVSVRFVGEKSSATVVEEMALLRAADLAREHGRTGLVIKERKDYQRTENTLYYGRVIRSDPAGYSTHLEVELVDLANLPERYRATPWRVLDVQAVIRSLGPTYVAPEAEGPSPRSS